MKYLGNSLFGLTVRMASAATRGVVRAMENKTGSMKIAKAYRTQRDGSELMVNMRHGRPIATNTSKNGNVVIGDALSNPEYFFLTHTVTLHGASGLSRLRYWFVDETAISGTHYYPVITDDKLSNGVTVYVSGGNTYLRVPAGVKTFSITVVGIEWYSPGPTAVNLTYRLYIQNEYGTGTLHYVSGGV